MNFVTAGSYMLIMKTFCALTVFVVAIAAWPSCLSYCGILHSGLKTARRIDCNCFSSEKKLQDEDKHERGVKSLLFPLKLQNRETIFKDLNNNQEHGRISLINVETDQILKQNSISGLGNSKPIDIKHNKKKRTPDDGDIPVEIDNHSLKASESTYDVLSNTEINERNLSDCIDLHILINIRKNKNVVNLDLDTLKNKENLNDFEINTAIKNKCDEANTIIKQSIAEIKEHKKINNKKMNENGTLVPKINSNIPFEVTDETTPVILTNDDISRRQYDVSKNATSYEESYTHGTTATDNTPKHSSEALNDINLSSTLDGNIQEEVTGINFNVRDLNDSVAFFTPDDNSIDIMDNFSRNLSVNSTTTTTNTIKTPADSKSNVSPKLKELSKHNHNDKFVTEKSLNPTFERIHNKSVQIANYSNNVKESKLEMDQFPKNSNKTVDINTINLIENKTFPRDKYNENEVPIIRIITREYPNHTISSDINGTEILPNSDFEEETLNNKTKTISENETPEIQSKSYDSSTPSQMLSMLYTSEKKSFPNTSSVINGRLYFVYGQKFVPGHFVQTPDGLLHLSLDLNTICNETNQKV